MSANRGGGHRGGGPGRLCRSTALGGWHPQPEGVGDSPATARAWAPTGSRRNVQPCSCQSEGLAAAQSFQEQGCQLKEHLGRT